MIHFLVTEGEHRTITAFLEGRGSVLQSRVVVESYDQVMGRRHHERGTYVFADLERLTSERRSTATELYDRLAARPGSYTLVNSPRASLTRFPLLKKLHADGFNQFDVFRLEEPLPPVRFPVFLRREMNHNGPLTPLLQDRVSLSEAIENEQSRRRRRTDLMVVEYLETQDFDRLYRKYGVFRVGDRLVPRHIFFGRHWVVKNGGAMTPRLSREEYEFVRSNAHDRMLWSIFETAGIEYGRIDYGFYGGELQVWEINTNPSIMSRRPRRHLVRGLLRRRSQLLVRDRLVEAIRRLECPPARSL
jgi:hypothetical protein